MLGTLEADVIGSQCVLDTLKQTNYEFDGRVQATRHILPKTPREGLRKCIIDSRLLIQVINFRQRGIQLPINSRM